jgi:hypothetical protein
MNLNGEILSRDKVIAVLKDGRITDSDPALLPLYLKRTGDVEGWLAARAIDSHRANSRLLKRALRLAGVDDAELVLKVNAVTITDTYWVRESGNALTYDDVRFKRNIFDKLALAGDPDSFNQKPERTPELTNIGSFEKCWRLNGDSWEMVKQGNELELFSELFVCKLGQALGFHMAEYRLDGGTLVSPDFTNGASVNYESADGIVGGNEDYAANFTAFRELSPLFAEQYLQIIYLDTLCFNMDRHTKNYGILRDVESGKIISLAPNFDNNIALFARGIPQNLARSNDKLIELFAELIDTNAEALRVAESFPVPTSGMVGSCAKAIPIAVSTDALTRFVMNGSGRMQTAIRAPTVRQTMKFTL